MLTKFRDLVLHSLVHWLLTPAENDVRAETLTPQLPYTRLSRLRLVLTSSFGSWHKRHVDVAKVCLFHLELELTEGFTKGHSLNVTDGAPKLNDAHLRYFALPTHGQPSHPLDPLLDGVGDVRHHLDSLAQVIPLSLLADHALVNLPCRNIVVPTKRDVQKTFIVAKVEVNLEKLFEGKLGILTGALS